ncbi:hypothetical protein [Pseudomonas matsuisoli]|nr:hypothetical protein [Pseudomonas matsuisoli]
MMWLFGAPVMAAEAPRLSVQRLDDGAAEVQVCFARDRSERRYELLVTHRDLNGNRSQSRQRGTVAADGEGCPVQTRIGLKLGATLDVRLRWWQGAEEQPAIEQRLEGQQST